MNPQDQIYIDSVKEQINSGMYDNLFNDVVGIDHGPKSNLVFLDIGANIGLVSIYAVPYCKRIVAVEPAPDTFKALIKNTGNYQIIECIRTALASVNGEIEFYINDINFTASSTVNTYGTRTDVPCNDLITILSFVGDHVDICKIDAEGAEGEALNLDQLDAASGIIKQYYIETHNCPKTSWEHKLGTIVGNLARVGYSKMEINGMSITACK